MEVTDLDDDGWGQLIKEIELDGRELEELGQNLDTGFVWLSLLQDILPILRRFIDHLKSIDNVVHHLPNKDDVRHRFLIGTLFGGVVSAYEGMVHDFVDLLMNCDNYRSIERIKNIEANDLNRLRIKQGLGWDELALALGKATLNHPNIVARILNSLFEFSVPEADEDVLEHLIKMRNDFTHNNGFNNAGEAYEVYWKQLSNFIVEMDGLVAMYVQNVQVHAHRFLEKTS